MVLNRKNHNDKSSNNNRAPFLIRIVLIIVIIVLVVDTTTSNVSDLLNINLVWWGIPLFIVIIASSFGIGQYFILEYVQHLTSKINRNNKVVSATTITSTDATISTPSPSPYRLNLLNRTVTATQYYIVTPIIVLVVLQVIIASYYYPILITVAMTISYLLSGIIFGLLSIRFFQWFLRSNYNNIKISKNISKGKDNISNDSKSKNIIVLSYALASAVTTIAVVFTLIFYDSIIVTSFRNIITSIVYVHSPIVFPTFDPNSMMGVTNYIYSIFNIISFLLLWTSSVLLLQQYSGSRRFGRLRFSSLLIAPLLFFLSQFVVLAIPLAKSDTYLITFYTLQGLVAGLLFGIPFLVVSRSITITISNNDSIQQGQERHTRVLIKEYLSLSAYGFILFFVSGTATIVHTPYPPLGLVSVSFVGLSSYMIFVGLYHSAVVISQDSSLRQAIRILAIGEEKGGRPKLLDSIGTAQMQQDIEKRVTKLVNEQAYNIHNQTGVYLTPTEDDIKQYLSDVLTEISEAREQESKKKQH